MDLSIPKLNMKLAGDISPSIGQLPPSDLYLYIDGSSRPNPGEMRIGLSLHYQGTEIHNHSEAVGTGSNNNAEFCALIQGLQLLKALEEHTHPASKSKCIIVSDSTLLVNSINDKGNLKEKTLKEQLVMALELMVQLKQLPTVIWVPRDKNGAAHKLSYQKDRISALR